MYIIWLQKECIAIEVGDGRLCCLGDRIDSILAALASLHQDDLKNRMISWCKSSFYSSYHPDAQ